MKNPIVFALLLGSCSFAAAQGKVKELKSDAPLSAEQKKFDLDKDAKLSRDELKAFREEVQKLHDIDKDGKLSSSEKKGMQAAILRKYDADKDGTLNSDETKVARDAGEDVPAKAASGAKKSSGGAAG